MAGHPFSPPLLPSDYYHGYSIQPSSIPSQNSPRKRKREFDIEDLQFPESDHIPKKQRDEIVTPLTPTSPPSSLSSIQALSPPADQRLYHSYNPPVTNDNDIQPSSNLSYFTYPPTSKQQVHQPDSSRVDTAISSQNLFLRDLHLKSRAYQNNQCHFDEIDKDEDEEMWEEEEESVTERYAAMNKLLGSRRKTR